MGATGLSVMSEGGLEQNLWRAASCIDAIGTIWLPRLAQQAWPQGSRFALDPGNARCGIEPERRLRGSNLKKGRVLASLGPLLPAGNLPQ